MNTEVDFVAEVVTPTTVKPTITIEALTELMRSEEDFTTFFKKKATTVELGKGHWILDPKTKVHRLTLPDGSYVRLKFFNAVKKIFNSKNIEVPGRESHLSYIDVAVMPKGVKGYGFLTNQAQHVWGYSQSKADAAHVISLAKLQAIAEALGIDLSQPGAWETYYAGKR